MITYIIMGGIVLFLGFELLWSAKLTDDTQHFLDKENSNAMRGFWCFIVILVHTPVAYQNSIQEMIGSFAYIGVSFFFMTSGYGLTYSVMKTNSTEHFWYKRLPKLLIVSWIVGLLSSLLKICLLHGAFNILDVIIINKWVLWLIACYVLFWITQVIFRKKRKLGFVICISVVPLISILIYVLVCAGVITDTTWTTECYGFIWGILLSIMYDKFVKKVKNKWMFNVIIFGIICIVLGVAYLKFKTIVFFGDYLLKIILGISILLFILVCNVKIKIGNRLNLFFGNISFEIYLIHGMVFYFLGKLINSIDSGLFILISIIITIILSIGIHYLSELLIKGFYRMKFPAGQVKKISK